MVFLKYKSVGSPTKPFRADMYEDWIGGPEEPLIGFSWRGGSKRDTTGVIMWSDVFLHEADNGDKIAIILMDTQGLFDTKTSQTDNSRILSMSTLMSSVQIYNLPRQIQEDNLEYLQVTNIILTLVN